MEELELKLREEGKTNWEVDTYLNLQADKYRKSRSKFEVENLGNFEKIYPSSNNRPLYIAMLESAN